MLEISFIPAFRDNYIWLLVRGERAVVVDPGDAEPVAGHLRKHGLVLEAILITHHHGDHQGGVEALAARWQPAVFGPASESITGCNRPLCGGERITVLDETFDVMAVPGHTLGHLAYVMTGAAFVGDTLFGAGCGRLFEGTPEQMVASLRRLTQLPAATRLYCAHEYTAANLEFAAAVEPANGAIVRRRARVAELRARGAATVPLDLAEERETNPFIRCTRPEVIRAAQARNPGASDPVAVFAAIREWKNEF
ncbi:MAG: hydroxyacylglutathione hydrolase [Dechloromonas sp.]|nr:hydroxyacylglutathione hydrolase [Dechloromonas sp.]